ncbi:MAG: hypothetical protein BWY29_01074 [Microgenomates group bacterium ADurb.Bin238]|nr:MAG: hypothetical protein BWY29_01074 [Microgenomates group bacterium ADurb.Bin238]
MLALGQRARERRSMWLFSTNEMKFFPMDLKMVLFRHLALKEMLIGVSLPQLLILEFIALRLGLLLMINTL